MPVLVTHVSVDLFKPLIGLFIVVDTASHAKVLGSRFPLTQQSVVEVKRVSQIPTWVRYGCRMEAVNSNTSSNDLTMLDLFINEN